MQFSMWPSAERTTAELLDRARQADADGWFGVWIMDHYMPNTGTEEVARGDIHECWALLAAIAAVTERVRIGSLVSPTSVHHPAVLAKRATTVDHLSNGRLVLGIGAGWQINEHQAYGIELEPPGVRVSRFEEAIQVIRALLADDLVDFHGDFYDITGAPADPKPVQAPLPILVGTASPRMLGITVAHADEWNTWGAPELAIGNRQKMLAACERAGRDPASMHTSTQALVFLTDDTELAERVLNAPMGPRTIAGNAEQLAAELRRYADAGFDEFIVLDNPLGASPAARAEAYARLQAEVFSLLD